MTIDRDELKRREAALDETLKREEENNILNANAVSLFAAEAQAERTARQRAEANAAAIRALLRCAGCGKPATCHGVYEDGGVIGESCDDCCGHDNEYGLCTPILGSGAALLAELRAAEAERDAGDEIDDEEDAAQYEHDLDFANAALARKEKP